MDDLPELPFEKVLSYLSLEERLKARAVSKRWYHKINSFKAPFLFYSERPIGFIIGKQRLIDKGYASNFVRSTNFGSFFNTFGKSILSSLKKLRLCGFRSITENRPNFIKTLNSFEQLEDLVLFSFGYELDKSKGPSKQFKLNLPMLRLLKLSDSFGFEKLAVNAPNLKKVCLVGCASLKLELVHPESVETLLTDKMAYMRVAKLNNLKFLFNRRCQNDYTTIHPTLLYSLPQLIEVHLGDRIRVEEFFKQKQLYGRTDLKIHLHGCLLDSPDDPPIPESRFFYLNSETFVALAANSSRLTNRIRLFDVLDYSAVEDVAPGLEVNLLNKLPDLIQIGLYRPVQDVQRFLELLKTYREIVSLEVWCDQPQDLFDRLHEHCSVQDLIIRCKIVDFQFLFRLKHLVYLNIRWTVDADFIQRVFANFEFISSFLFKFDNKEASIRIDHPNGPFKVSADRKRATVVDLNEAIRFINSTEVSAQKKRKSETLSE